MSKHVEICRFFVYLVDLFRIGADCLEVVCELKLVCLGSPSIVCPSTLAHETAFWILMGRSLLIRDRELVPSYVFMGRVDVLLCNLKA
jgi:hypothetical protein